LEFYPIANSWDLIAVAFWTRRFWLFWEPKDFLIKYFPLLHLIKNGAPFAFKELWIPTPPNWIIIFEIVFQKLLLIEKNFLHPYEVRVLLGDNLYDRFFPVIPVVFLILGIVIADIKRHYLNRTIFRGLLNFQFLVLAFIPFLGSIWTSLSNEIFEFNLNVNWKHHFLMPKFLFGAIHLNRFVCVPLAKLTDIPYYIKRMP
jgi:hypothetical protein